MDCSLPGSSTHGIFQARVLEWVTIAFSDIVCSDQIRSVAQSCPTLCDPIDGSPPSSPVPGILQARTPEWVAISFSNAWKWKVKVKSLSHVRLLATPRTAAYQAPLSMRFSRQEYWSGVLLPSPILLPVPLKWERKIGTGCHQCVGRPVTSRKRRCHQHFNLVKLFFLIKDNCFTILVWFLPYINMNGEPFLFFVSLSKLGEVGEEEKLD